MLKIFIDKPLKKIGSWYKKSQIIACENQDLKVQWADFGCFNPKQKCEQKN